MLYPPLANPSSFYFLSPIEPRCLAFMSDLSSLTLSAYLNVFRVCSQQFYAGETLAIIVVLLLPTKESFSTCVSLEPLNGVCFFSKSSALIHSLSARSDLLISAPSYEVFLSLCMVSAPRSEPARSMKLIFEYSEPLCLRTIYITACEREL